MDGMKRRGVQITILLVFCFVLIPLLISCIHTSGAAYIKEVGFEEHQHLLVVSNPVLTAGNFHCLDVTLTDDAHKISIVAYLGSEVPDVENRSIKNYYRWEYNNGRWQDKSGYESSYIKPSRCKENGYIYSFYIGLDARADTGDWTIKISVDNKDAYSSPLNVETIHFDILLFTICTDGFKLDKNDLPEFFKKHRKINHQEQTTTNKELLEDIEAFIDHSLGNRPSLSQIKAFAVPVKKTPLYDELVDKLIKDHPSIQETDEGEEIENYCEVEKTIVVDSSLKVSTKKGAIPPPVGKIYRSSVFRGGVPILVAFLLISLAFIPVITSFDEASFSISSFTLFPDEIINGESVLLNVSVSDTVGITSVVADIGGLETINLSFIEGTAVNDTVYSGFWQGNWLVHDVDPGSYTVVVTVMDKDNKSVSQQRVFIVLPAYEVNISDNTTSLESQLADSYNNMSQLGNETSVITIGNDTVDNESDIGETGNVAPVISGFYPSNGSVGVSVVPVLSVAVFDVDGDRLNITWYSNSSGAWVVFGRVCSVDNDTYTWVNGNFSEYNMTYWWYISVDDGNATNVSGVFCFATMPEQEYVFGPPDGFSAVVYNLTQINLTWTKNLGANNTYIVRKTGSYPSNRTDGINVYNGTNTWYNDTDLAPSTTYYYSAWSYNASNFSWSEGYVTDSAATAAEEVNVTLDGDLSNDTISDFRHTNVTVSPSKPPLGYYVSDRGTNWDRYYNPSTGQYSLVAGLGPRNYQEDDGDWHPINCSFEPLDDTHPAYQYGYRAGNEKGLFNAYFKPNAQDMWPVAFAYNKSDDPTMHVLRSKLMGIGYLDPSSNWDYKILQQVQNSQGAIDGSSGTYPGVFSGVNVTWRYTNDGLKEEIILSNTTKTLLQGNPPSSFGLSNQHSYLVSITKLDYRDLTPYNGSMSISGNYTLDDGGIEFKDVAGAVKCSLPVDYAYELYASEPEPGNETDKYKKMTFRLIQHNGDYYLLSGIKVTTLNAMTFPVVFDPSIQVNVSAGVNDAHEMDSSISYSRTATYCRVDDSSTATNRYNTGLLFESIAILPGATIIDNAYMKVHTYSAGFDDPNLDIYCEDVDNAVDFDTNEDVTTRATDNLTSESTSWSASGLTPGGEDWAQTPDFASAVNEVINRTGWASGNNLCVLMKGKNANIGNLFIHSYEDTPVGTHDAELYINYTTLFSVADPYLAHNAVGVSVTPTTFNITVESQNGSNMDITWRSNSSGSWVTFGTNTSVANGTYRQTNSNFSNYSTDYYWSVNVTDGYTWANYTYKFTTETTDAPQVTLNSPSDGKGLATSPVLNVSVTDDLGWDMTVDWYGAGNYLSTNTTNGNETVTYSWDCGGGIHTWNVTVTEYEPTQGINQSTDSASRWLALNYFNDTFNVTDYVGATDSKYPGAPMIIENSYANFTADLYNNTVSGGLDGTERTIDATMYDSTDDHGPSPRIVFINSTHGYAFGGDTAGTDQFSYWKTIDGGVTWTGPTIIDSGTGDGGVTQGAVWYDQWTPGDSGTKIHLAAIGQTQDELKYNYFDTSTETTRGTWVTIQDMDFWYRANGGPAICKGTDGRLWAGGFGTVSVVKYSDDNGATWTDKTPGSYFNYAYDDIQLLPLPDHDIMCIYYDYSTVLCYTTYDSDTSTWSSFATIDTITHGYYCSFGASMWKQTGDIYLVFNTRYALLTADIVFWKYTPSNNTWWGETVIEPDAFGYDASVVVSQGNGDIYVFYADGGGLGTMYIYCQNSTDHGTTWSGSPGQQISTTYDDTRYTTGNFMSYYKIYASWHNEDTAGGGSWIGTSVRNYTLGAKIDAYANMTSVNITKPSGYDWDRLNCDVNNTANSTFSILNETGVAQLTGLDGNNNDISSVTSSTIQIWGEFNDTLNMNSWNVSWAPEAINTSVDTISPYEVTSSPLTINATNNTPVDNVTLWYHYSSDNSSWWNTSWSYRKSCNIFGNIDDYQMKIIVGNSSGGNITCGGHAQSDFDDIRFVNSTGNELPYWIENYTADDQATFWVKNSENDTKIWMYYGNSTVSTTSNGNNTFIWFEGFYGDSYNSSRWEIYDEDGSTHVTVADGIMSHISDSSTHSYFRFKSGYNVSCAGSKMLCTKVRSTYDTNGWATMPHITWYTEDAADTDNVNIHYRTEGGNRHCSNSNLGGSAYEGSSDISSSTWNADVWHYFNFYVDPDDEYLKSQILNSDGSQLGNAPTRSQSYYGDFDEIQFNIYMRPYFSGRNNSIDYIYIREWDYSSTDPSWSSFGSEESWMQWDNASQNPDTSSPWGWEFDFPNGTGYYEFYSIGKKSGSTDETAPSSADAKCRWNTAPEIINCSTDKNIYNESETVTFTAWVNDTIDDKVVLLIANSTANLDSCNYTNRGSCIANSSNITISSQPQQITATMTASDDTTWYAKVCDQGGLCPLANWTSPTGYEDPDNKWSSETNTYDEDTGTYASSSSAPNGDTSYIILNHSAIGCNKVRFWAWDDVPAIPKIYVDVLRNGSWIALWPSGYQDYPRDQWVEKTFSSGSVTKARIRWHFLWSGPYNVRLYEFDFWRTSESGSFSLNKPPEIGTPTADTDPVGYGYNVTINVSVWDDIGVSDVKCDVTYPDSTNYNFTMVNTGGTYYEKEINLTDTWQFGQHNYTIWATDGLLGNTSSQYSFNVSAQCNVTVQTEKDSYGANEYVNLTDPPGAAWLEIDSSHYYDHCGDIGPPYTLEGALDGTDLWVCLEYEVHWFILDLGESYTITMVHGRSDEYYGDPIDVDIYVTDDLENWGPPVAEGIDFFDFEWVEVPTDEKDGQYVKVEILETLDGPEGELTWGSSYDPFTIFDVYGEAAGPPPNNPPAITPIYPTNGSTDIPLESSVTCRIWANDSDGDNLDVTWATNESGSWVNKHTNTSVSANSTVSYAFTDFNSNNTKYWWKVYVDDGTDNVSRWFYFTTELGYTQSKIDNVGTTNCRGYLLIQIHYNDSGNWYTVEDTIDETSTRTINAGNHLKLDAIFNGTVYTSTNLTNGTGEYKVYVAFRDKFGNVLKNDDDTYMNASCTFNYTAVPINTSVDTISPYEVTSSPLTINATNYTAVDNVTLWYRYSVVNVSGAYEWSYQEDADSTSYPTSCGDWDLVYDGDWDTGDGCGDGGRLYGYMNYTKPANAVSANVKAKWWASIGGTRNQNYTLSSDCFDLDPIQLRWVYDDTTNNNYIGMQYYNGSTWKTLFGQGGANFGKTIYEEGMWWNISWSQWISWNDTSNPDTESPWQWSFDFPNDTGYYEFYSIGKKSGSTDETAPSSADAICYYSPANNPPTLTGESPANTSTGISLQPTCNVTVNDADADTMDVTFASNYSDLWVNYQTNSTVGNGSYSWSFTGANSYSTKYWWKVYANDSTDNSSEWYYFTTEVDTTPPTIVINFAGNLSDSGGPYWRPPGESDVLDEVSEGDFRDGYYTNDSRQQEDWIYINLSVVDDGGVDEVWLHWYNVSSGWINNSYQFVNVAGDYWEYNTSGNIQTSEGYDYSFDIWVNDTNNNANLTWWNKTGMGDGYTRRYVQLNCTQTNTMYMPFYFISINETHTDPTDDFKRDRLHHDQGTDGTATDTGYLRTFIPSGNVENAYCDGYVGFWFDENICIEPISIDNIYYHFWWSAVSSQLSSVGWYRTRDYLFNEYTDKYETLKSDNRSQIYYDNGNGAFPNDYYLDTNLLNVSNGDYNFTDNDIYELVVKMTSNKPSVISNRSFTSFVLLNVPDNATLNASYADTDSDSLSDWTELYVTYTNPFLKDTDNDGINDYWENQADSDPNNYTETFNVSNNAPIINSYNLSNSTGSKLNSNTGLLVVNNEYYFTVNITDENGWNDIQYINITAWYDNESESTTYNQTGNKGGNLNMFLQYENTTGTASYTMLWPDDEAELISGNCSETIINSTTRVVNISFKPKSQVRYANTTGGWNTTQNATNDLNSWNFNITVVDNSEAKAWKIDEYGVYKYTFIEPSQNWVGVIALPGENDTSDVVAVTYSSNYDFNMTIWFEENLANQTKGTTILIANNIDILNDADPNDDIDTGDITFNGIGEVNAVDIFNTSGIFSKNNVSQTVDVQFNVRIPLGTMWGEYIVHIGVKIIQKT